MIMYENIVQKDMNQFLDINCWPGLAKIYSGVPVEYDAYLFR